MARFSFDDKLNRANQLLEILRAELQRWQEIKSCVLTDEFDPNTGEDVLYLELFGESPILLPRIVGDCLHNLRSCLDHLVYALALANRPALTDAEATETAFPIFRKEEGFTTKGVGRIKYLCPRARAVIKGLQPYHAGDDAESHWLWLLRELENIDKHRRLLFTVAVLNGGYLGIPSRGEFRGLEPYIGPLQGKTEITRYQMVNMDTAERMKVNLIPTLSITFTDRPAEGREVLSTLESIRQYIDAMVVPPLRTLL